MKHRLFIALLALLIVAALSFGAGQGEGDAAGADAGFNESGYPIVDQPVTLTMVTNSVPMTRDHNTLPMFQSLEDLTNVRVEWEQVRSGYGEKKSLILASGDLPDAFFGMLTVTDSDILNNSSFFVPMNDLIDRYGHNIEAMFAEAPITAKMAVMPDGNIYGLPQTRFANPSHETVMWINQEWLDALDLDAPTDLDEFYDVLKAFKEGDPNGNGVADEIPLLFNGSGIHAFAGIDVLLSPFGIAVPGVANIAPLTVVDGQAKLYPALEEYRDAMKFYHRLYSEGLIYSEVFTQADQFSNIGKSPDNATVGVGLHYLHTTLLGQWATQYTHLLPLEGPGGRNYAFDPGVMRMGKNTFMITSANEYPEVTMRWANELYDPMMSMQLFFGSIGDRLIQNDDGSFGIVPPPEGVAAGPWKWENGPADRSPMHIPETMIAKVTQDPETSYRNVQIEQELTPFYFPADRVYPPVSLTQEESQTIARLYVTVKGYMDQMLAEFIVNGDVDQKWPEYIRTLESMGFEQLEATYQAAYARFIQG